MNKPSCILQPTVEKMGGDACTGTIKSLAVQVHCSANGSAPNVSARWHYMEGQTNNAVPLASGMVRKQEPAAIDDCKRQRTGMC